MQLTDTLRHMHLLSEGGKFQISRGKGGGDCHIQSCTYLLVPPGAVLRGKHGGGTPPVSAPYPQ